jgi:hypothetical protein
MFAKYGRRITGACVIALSLALLAFIASFIAMGMNNVPIPIEQVLSAAIAAVSLLF